MTERIWRDIPGETRYEVSNDGLIRTKPQVLKPYPNRVAGHLYVTLSNRKRMLVHRAVALAFLENPEQKRCVNHKNGKSFDNRLENLEWATHSENNLHGYRSNGRRHYSVFPVYSVNSDGEVTHYDSVKAAAEHHQVTRGAIHAALRNGGTCRKLHWKKA
jgi:hypothetical protein